MFDKDKIKLNRKKCSNAIANAPFYLFLHENLMDRLSPINKRFNRILLIRSVLCAQFIASLQKNYPSCKIEVTDPDFNPSDFSHKFDLVIFPFGAHWISDIQLFLKHVCQIIDINGIFLANFAGSGTLSALRKRIIELEGIYTNNHAIHISPFISFPQLVPLLQQAGFTETIADYELIELEYQTPLLLAHAIKDAGESNGLKGKIFYSINKQIYRALATPHAQEDTKPFIDNINLISFVTSPTKKTIALHSEYFDTEK